MFAAKSKAWSEIASSLKEGLRQQATVTHSVSQDAGGLLKQVPQQVLFPHDVQELSSIVRHASSCQLPLSVRGGGKTTEGESLSTETVVALNKMQAVRHFDPEHSLVTVEAGCNFHQLYEFLKPKGWDYLSAPLNMMASIGGTLGVGGIDCNSPFLGCSADQCQSLEVVTPQGEIEVCSEQSNQDLFEQVLMGYGQFGVISAATLKVRPARDSHVCYRYFHRLDQALPALLKIIKQELADYAAVLSLLDQVCVLSLGFDSKEKYDHFNRLSESWVGLNESQFTWQRVCKTMVSPSQWSVSLWLKKMRDRMIPLLNDPMYSDQGRLQQRSVAMARLVWSVWGHLPLVIPDLVVHPEDYVAAAEQGSAITKKYFKRFTLYCIPINRFGWKPRYDFSFFPRPGSDHDSQLACGIEFEPFIDKDDHDPVKIQDFKDEIYDLGVTLNGRAYRFGGAMKHKLPALLGDDFSDFKKAKEAADPQLILNPQVVL